jgi:hypothetical protein
MTDKSENSFENNVAKGGYFLRGKLNGFGTAKFSNGNEYLGEFRDGVFSGKGQLIYKEIAFGAGKGTYTGGFRGNKRDGYGEMIWGTLKQGANGVMEGEIFKGVWHNDRRVKGWLRMADGTEYDGDWRDDVMHGYGRLTFKPEKKGEKSIIFEGRFINGI